MLVGYVLVIHQPIVGVETPIQYFIPTHFITKLLHCKL